MILQTNSSKIASSLNPLFSYLQKQRENQRFIKLLEIGFTFLFISFFTFFAIKPTVTAISVLLGEIKSKQFLTKELKGKINNIIIAQDLFSQVQERYSLVESSLPITPGLYGANSQIVASANNHQIYLDKMNYIFDNTNFFTTNISTSSSYFSSTSLITDILQNRRLIEIDTFTISQSKDNSSQGLNLSLPLKIYYWPKNAKK